jgi:hypothetical protein
MEWSLMGWVPALLLGCVLGGGIIAIPVLAQPVFAACGGADDSSGFGLISACVTANPHKH